MPELPEVETVKRTLNELITGKTIESVEVRLPRIIQKPDDPHVFAQWLAGRTFHKSRASRQVSQTVHGQSCARLPSADGRPIRLISDR